MTESRSAKVTARITPTMEIVLNYLEEKTGKSRSQLLFEALQNTYDFDALAAEAISFIEANNRFLNQSSENLQE